MKEYTDVLLGMTRDMFGAIAQKPELGLTGSFKMFRKFNRDASSYQEPSVMWKTSEYKTILDNANNLFNALSQTEQYKISLINAKRTTEDFFREPKWDKSLKKDMHESWHFFKCTLLELIQEKLKEKDIFLQIPNSNLAADFLHMNATIDPKHYQDFMAVMVLLPQIVSIQKNTVANIEKLIQQESGKMIISD